MRHIYVLAVLELAEEREAAGETQQNGDLNVDAQTQMTSFEINLKDKRFAAVIIKPRRICFHMFVKHLVCIEGVCS